MGNFVSLLGPQERDCVGKEFVGAALGRWGTGCDFLNDQKVTKESPGDGSDERLRAAGAHSHLSPGPPFTGAGHFGFLVDPGVQNIDQFLFYSRATGPFCYQNLQAFTS